MQRTRFDFDVITDPVEPRPSFKPVPNFPPPIRPSSGTQEKPVLQAAEPK